MSSTRQLSCGRIQFPARRPTPGRRCLVAGASLPLHQFPINQKKTKSKDLTTNPPVWRNDGRAPASAGGRGSGTTRTDGDQGGAGGTAAPPAVSQLALAGPHITFRPVRAGAHAASASLRILILILFHIHGQTYTHADPNIRHYPSCPHLNSHVRHIPPLPPLFLSLSVP